MTNKGSTMITRKRKDWLFYRNLTMKNSVKQYIKEKYGGKSNIMKKEYQ